MLFRSITKECPIHKAKKDHEGLKSQKEGKKKEIIIIIIIIKKKKEEDPNLVKLEDMQQEEGSRSGQRICSKKNQHQGPRTLMCPFEALRRRPWLKHGKAKMYVQISSKKNH